MKLSPGTIAANLSAAAIAEAEVAASTGNNNNNNIGLASNNILLPNVNISSSSITTGAGVHHPVSTHLANSSNVTLAPSIASTSQQHQQHSSFASTTSVAMASGTGGNTGNAATTNSETPLVRVYILKSH